jgi:hypothetical protein
MPPTASTISPQEGAVLAAPALVRPPVLIRGINHLARAQAGGMIAETVRIATVVQTDLVLAMFPVIPRVADAPRYWELHGAVAPMRTVVVAVSYGTVVVNEGRRALARPEAVADAIRLAERAVLPVRRKGAWYSRNVHLILVVVRVVIPSLAAVLADLFIRVLVHVTEVARTADVRTVRPVITAVALAEAIRTVALIIAVVRTIMNAQSPHVIEHHGWEGVIRRLFLFHAITDPTEHVDLA